MNRPKYSIQVYREAHGDKEGRWVTTRIIRRPASFIVLCALASKHTKRDKVGRQLSLYPQNERLCVFKYGKDGRYYEGLTALGSRVRDAELRAKEHDPTDEETIDAEELSGHRQLTSDIAESKQIMVRELKHYWGKTSRIERWFSNTPRGYHCLSCRLYFAIPSKRRSVKCKYCRSEKVKLVVAREIK